MKKPRPLLLRLLIGTLVTIAALSALVGVLLVRGITLGPLAVADVQLEQVFLQLDGKLKLDISGVKLPASKDKTEPAAGLEADAARSFLSTIEYLQRFFAAIDIRDIEVGDLSADFRYRENGGGHLKASGPGTDISIGLQSDEDVFDITIERFLSKDFGLELSGEVTINTLETTLESQLHAIIADTLPVSLELQADREQLSFSGKGEAGVSTIAPIVSLFKLGPGIDPWIIDYLRASEITLESVSGTLAYDDPAQILQTLRAEALVKDTEYTFAQGLEPALAEETRVVFEKGILHIYPMDTTFYGQDAGDTYVDIDFNNSEALLSVYVVTRAQASGGIITLLDHYDIPFPYEQTSGLTDVDLTIRINLSTVDITAEGRFIAEDGEFNIGDQPFDVPHLDMGIKTTILFFNQLDVAMPGLFSARIKGLLDAGKGHGDLDIALQSFRYQEATSELRLNASAEQPLPIAYHFRADGDSIDVAASDWQYGDAPISITPFTTAFDLATFSGSLDDVGIVIDPALRARVSGRYQAQAPYAALDIAVLKLGDDSLQLEQSRADIQLNIDDKLTVSSNKPVALSLDGIAIKVEPFRVNYHNSELRIGKSSFVVAPGTSAALQGVMNLATGKGRLLLHDLHLRGKDGKLLFGTDRSIYLNVVQEEQVIHLEIPRIGVEFSHRSDESWSVDIDDIGKFYAFSPLMQQLRLNHGEIHVSSASGATPYLISARIKSVFGLLVAEDYQPIHDYRFSGAYNGKELTLEVNDKLQIEWSDNIKLVSNDIGYSLPTLLKIIEAVDQVEKKPDETNALAAAPTVASKPAPQQTGDQSPALSLQANNSFIVIDEKRRTPVDKLLVNYSNAKATAKFFHGEGQAVFEYANDTIYFAGENFDIAVLTDLITLADFDGGTVEFVVEGKPEDLHAAFRIKNTVIKDYKTLNNMLAFVNTLPGLLTFNPPNYNTHGLPAREAYADLNYTDSVLELHSLIVDSDELDLRGSGTIDMKNETIDMTFNMISGAKKSVGRIPLLGFILVGDDKDPTLTLKVEGNMEDPKVSNTAAESIVTYPWQLIKRTVLLPGHVTNQLTDDDEDQADEQSDEPVP
jgi:hypothetical protein